MELIKASNLKKTFIKGSVVTEVIRGIDLTIEKGDFVTITGPSGSDKSTLLYLLSGLEPVSEGNIFIEQENITKMGDTELSLLRRNKLAFIFQFYNLLSEMNVIDNILLPKLIEKNKIDKEKIKEILKMVGLEKYEKSYPYELSGGQQQRVAIARALYANPEIIFADEPTGNLDSKTSAHIMELLSEIHAKKETTIVMVTHSEKYSKIGNRKICIEDGVIC